MDIQLRLDQLESELKRQRYYTELLMHMVNADEHPFFAMMIDFQVNKESVQSFLQGLHEFNQTGKGIISFAEFSAHVKQTLGSEVSPKSVLMALKRQKIYSQFCSNLLDQNE